MRKPAEKRQRRNKLIELVGEITSVPAIRDGLLTTTQERWVTFWQSEVAMAVNAATDMPTVERLFSLYDERERAYRAYRKRRMVEGSTGQDVINPMWKQVPVMDAEIRQLEDRLGMSPKARAQLGIVIAGAKKGLDDLNRELEVDQDDPRD